MYIVTVTVTVVILLILLLILKRNTCIKAHVINLKKNKQRYERFMNSYTLDIPIERFDAIVGKELDPQEYISKNAYDTLQIAEKNGYRKRHSELTRGAIGCYLSHVELYKKLLSDECEYYLIFEDDAELCVKNETILRDAIKNAPSDWDMISFARGYGYSHTEIKGKYTKYYHFFGLTCYLINKKGARKFLDEFNSKPITMQIDSKMSLMIQKGNFVVYGYSDYILEEHSDAGTDIQIPVYENEEAFILEDL